MHVVAVKLHAMHGSVQLVWAGVKARMHMGCAWVGVDRVLLVCADSFFHTVASPFHSFIRTRCMHRMHMSMKLPALMIRSRP